jgi:hypothetical protein
MHTYKDAGRLRSHSKMLIMWMHEAHARTLQKCRGHIQCARECAGRCSHIKALQWNHIMVHIFINSCLDWVIIWDCMRTVGHMAVQKHVDLNMLILLHQDQSLLLARHEQRELVTLAQRLG